MDMQIPQQAPCRYRFVCSLDETMCHDRDSCGVWITGGSMPQFTAACACMRPLIAPDFAIAECRGLLFRPAVI